MKSEQAPPHSRGIAAIGGAMALIIILLIVQIWLLTATLEAYLAGTRRVAVPAALFSGVIFTCCLALYVFVDRIDQEARRRR
jgi:hypothetical protein